MSNIAKYNRTIWVNDQTKLNAKNMNNIEDGIELVTNEVILLEEIGLIEKITLNGNQGTLEDDIWKKLQLKPENYSFYLSEYDLMLSYAKNNTDEINIEFAYTYNDVEYLKEYYLTIINGEWHIEIIENTLPNKVDKIEGKGLSTNDFSDEYKKELDNLPNKLNKNLVTNIDTNVSGDNININITYTNLNNDNEQSVTKILSPVTNTTPGLMTSEDLNALNTLKSKVENLEGKTTRLLYTESTNPTKEEINNFVIGLGYTSPFEGIAVVIAQTYHIWHYYSNDNIGWKDDGQDTVSAFTNDIAGIIKGSRETEGKVYAESDGTGSVNGWDTLTTKINNHINNTNNPHKVTKAQVGLENVENKVLDNKVTENSTNYIQSGAVFDAINNGDLVHDTRKIAGHDLKTDITAEQLYSALELGTAAKKDTGNSAEQLPIIGSDGKLPSSIIPKTVDSKELVTEVTELAIPTKNDPYIVVKDEEVYRRNALIDTDLPTLYTPEAGYHTYYIVKGNTSTYYVVWSKSDNLSIVGDDRNNSDYDLYALIQLEVMWGSYYATANSESEAISKITSPTTTYTKLTNNNQTFDLATVHNSSSSKYSAKADVSLTNPPFIKSNVSSKTYVTSNHCYWELSSEGLPSWYVRSVPTETTQSNIPQIEGYFSDEITPNSYKKLADKEYVDTKLDKVTTTTSANQAYVKNMDGSQGMIPIVQGVSGDSIPRRLADGRLQAKAGTNNDDVVNKKQLDDAIAAAITTALNTAV